MHNCVGCLYICVYIYELINIFTFLQGKGLIFVNDVNKCYKLKLFLQQFFISAAVLNSEVPLNSRTHMLEEFNRYELQNKQHIS
jgi:ATP-dependent RNA helicase DDX56/DBP9